MNHHNELYSKYDLLLPSKFDGGYLIVTLHEKIRNQEIEEYFTQREINEILKEITVDFELDAVRQWSSIKDNLFHYFLRSHPDEPWKYYLTDYAKKCCGFNEEQIGKSVQEPSIEEKCSGVIYHTTQ